MAQAAGTFSRVGQEHGCLSCEDAMISPSSGMRVCVVAAWTRTPIPPIKDPSMCRVRVVPSKAPGDVALHYDAGESLRRRGDNVYISPLSFRLW